MKQKIKIIIILIFALIIIFFVGMSVIKRIQDIKQYNQNAEISSL